MNSARIKVAGASYHQPAIKGSKPGDKVRLVPDPSNAFDSFAIRLVNARLESSGDGWLGFIPMKYGSLMSKAIRSGHCFAAQILSTSGAPIMGATVSLQAVPRASAVL